MGNTIKVYEYLDNNLESFKNLVKLGFVSPKYLQYYNIFCVYRSAENIKSRMNRLYFTSDVCKINPQTVRTALKLMRSELPSCINI